jgi:hypothetical protein
VHFSLKFPRIILRQLVEASSVGVNDDLLSVSIVSQQERNSHGSGRRQTRRMKPAQGDATQWEAEGRKSGSE